jgi:hypothetical protein
MQQISPSTASLLGFGRDDALSKEAQRLGLKFSISDHFGLDARYRFQVFQMAAGRYCENVMWGIWENSPVIAFDLCFATPASGHRETWSCAMASFPSQIPHVIVAPETFLTRRERQLSFHDVEFESVAFNSRSLYPMEN